MGSRRLEALSGTQVRIYASDSLDSARIITDNTGVVYYDADFTPFGGERAYADSYPTLFKFEGKMRDYETGNDDFGARYYSNRFGRWLSADWSNVPVAVPYANLTNPQTLNLYSMVADDPESFADLDGHISLPGQEGEGCSPVGGACSEREIQKVPPGMSGCAIVGYICAGPTQNTGCLRAGAQGPCPGTPDPTSTGAGEGIGAGGGGGDAFGQTFKEQLREDMYVGEIPIGPGRALWEGVEALRPLSKMGHAAKHLKDFRLIDPNLSEDSVAKILTYVKENFPGVAQASGKILHTGEVFIGGVKTVVKVVVTSSGNIRSGFPVP